MMREGFDSSWSVISAAHELKAPLIAMRQMALYLENELKETTTSNETKKTLYQLIDSSSRSLQVVTDLTQASRISVDNDSLFSLEPVNVYSVCQEVVQEFMPVVRLQGRSFSLKKKHRTPIVVAHRDFLRRILANFTSNALQYSSQGAHIEIEISHKKAGESIVIAVRDSGDKIPSKVWKAIQHSLKKDGEQLPMFSPELLTKNGFASGIGLYICRQFAQAMNAKIGATRHQNGATFFVEIATSRQLSLLDV